MWNSPKDVNIFPPESKIFHVGLSKHVLTKQTAHISTFNIRNITNKISKHRQHSESQSCTNRTFRQLIKVVHVRSQSLQIRPT